MLNPVKPGSAYVGEAKPALRRSGIQGSRKSLIFGFPRPRVPSRRRKSAAQCVYSTAIEQKMQPVIAYLRDRCGQCSRNTFAKDLAEMVNAHHGGTLFLPAPFGEPFSSDRIVIGSSPAFGQNRAYPDPKNGPPWSKAFAACGGALFYSSKVQSIPSP